MAILALFADVVDAIENDRKPYVDAVAEKCTGTQFFQYTKSQKLVM